MMNSKIYIHTHKWFMEVTQTETQRQRQVERAMWDSRKRVDRESKTARCAHSVNLKGQWGPNTDLKADHVSSFLLLSQRDIITLYYCSFFLRRRISLSREITSTPGMRNGTSVTRVSGWWKITSGRQDVIGWAANACGLKSFS